MLTPFLGGRSYSLALIDNFTFKSDILFLNSKDQLFDATSEYVAKSERINSKKGSRFDWMELVSTKGKLEQSRNMWKKFLRSICLHTLLKALERQKDLCRNLCYEGAWWWIALRIHLNFGPRPCIMQTGNRISIRTEVLKMTYVLSCGSATPSLTSQIFLWIRRICIFILPPDYHAKKNACTLFSGYFCEDGGRWKALQNEPLYLKFSAYSATHRFQAKQNRCTPINCSLVEQLT